MTTNPKNEQYEGVAEITEDNGRWKVEYKRNDGPPWISGTKMADSLIEADAWCVARGLEVQTIRS